MNAAILLVTSAWMTGQAPEVIVPVQHAPAASACGNSCGGSCCDDGGGIGHRLRGLFHRNRGGDCCEPQPADCCESRGHRLFGGHRRSSCDDACQDSCNDSCGCGGPSFFERIRGMFHRDRGCCADSCCGDASGHNGGTVIVPGTPAPGAEPLKEQPKKMPSKAAPKQTTVITPSVQTPITPALQNAPAINAPGINVPAVDAPAIPAAPAIAPRIETERNPF